jgi:hypothetical protein
MSTESALAQRQGNTLSGNRRQSVRDEHRMSAGWAVGAIVLGMEKPVDLAALHQGDAALHPVVNASRARPLEAIRRQRERKEKEL